MECFSNQLKINLGLKAKNQVKNAAGCRAQRHFTVVVTPVRALQVTPANPQLGDTISDSDGNPAVSSSPTVAFNQKTYPV